MQAYYNEFDPKAAAWLRQLIKNGNITQGEVDERSITEVEARDLQGFDRVHFFAGIGTWDYCLNKAGWGDRPIWTASLPCQPFSAAGKGLGKADERHLLPHYLNLVRECRPNIQIGEQVERAIAHGWLDDLQATMEAEGYAVGHCVLGAHSIGAPHIRQRLYWVANSNYHRGRRLVGRVNGEENGGQISGRKSSSIAGESSGTSEHVCGMADSKVAGKPESGYRQLHSEGFTNGPFGNCTDDIEWVYCRDKKYRPIKPGIFPLVDGATGGMVYSGDSSAQINANETLEAKKMRLKGYGNAIQAQTAIAFIKAYLTL